MLQPTARLFFTLLPGSAGRPALPTVAEKGGLLGAIVRKVQLSRLHYAEGHFIRVEDLV